MRRTLHHLSAIGLSIALLASPALAAAVDGELIYEDWHVLRIQGADSGYVHSTITREGTESEPLFVVDIETAMKMNRMGAVVDVQSWQRTTEREDGSFVGVESSMTMSNRPTATEVTFTDGIATVRTTVMDETRTKEVEVPDDCRGPYWLATSVLDRLDEAGETYVVTTWTPDTNGPADVRIEIVGREDVIVMGAKRSLMRYESTLESMGVTQSTWVDDEGFALRTSTPMMGMSIETVATDAATARAAYANGGELSPDVFAQSVVVSERHLPASRSVSDARLRITPRAGSIELSGVEDTRQRIVSREESGAIVLDVARRVPNTEHGGTRPIVDVPDDLAECLAPSSMIQSDHPDIAAIAERVIDGESDAWVAAQRLEAWVEANVTEKSMDVGFASALEVCTDRAGDCTEHAVLLCALARAAGIPSRVAMGLLYIGGIWGGHAWTEVWIDGDWYALDGTVGTGDVDALHLTIARLPLAEGSPMTDFAALLDVIGKVEIDVESLTVGDRTIDMRRADLVRVANGRYTNEAWGLAFDVRDGWEVELREPSTRIGFDLLELEGRTEDGKKVTIEVSAFDRVYARTVRRMLRAPALDPDGDASAAGGRTGDERIGDGLTDLDSLRIDGRRAWYVDGSGIVRIPRRIAIDAGERWFLFEMDRINGEAQQALFEELVRSIDLDAGS